MRTDIFEFFRKMPCFTKQNLRIYFDGKEDALNERIKRALKNKIIYELKRGLYTTEKYFLNESMKTEFKEFITSKLRFPSYLSKEYVLSKYAMLTEATYPVTSITVKTNRTYRNFLGTYIYSHVKKDIYFGFEQVRFYRNAYFIATKPKALFDYLYLKINIGPNLKKEILSDLRINWENFTKKDFALFKEYALRSGSRKMSKISKTLEKKYGGK